ncbi:MAG: hypothetical protein ACTSPY_12605 [Candidatus Helarchaeota archaeon]
MAYKTNKKIFISFFWIGLILNIVTIVFHIISTIGILILQEPTGYLMIISIIYNIFLIILNFNIINRADKSGKLIKNLLWLDLVFFYFWTIVIAIYPIKLFLINNNLFNLIISILFFVVYYGIFGFGVLISFLDIRNSDNLNTWR